MSFTVKDRRTNLVLTREKGEVLQIGDDITITFIDIFASRAVVSIKAPKSTKILRAELQKY